MKKIAIACLLVVILAFAASAATFTRALPNSNLNAAAGVNRSNVSWGTGYANLTGDVYLIGDDFSFANNVIVDAITIYSVSNNGDGTPESEFDVMDLYLGSATGAVSLASSTYTSQLVSSLGYQGGSGAFYGIYALTFSGLNFAASANTLYGFALDGYSTTSSNFLALHASNAALSGTLQEGPDNQVRIWNYNNGNPIFNSTVHTAAPGWWDKGSDINVLISATDFSDIPEPSTVALLSLGLGALLVLRRRG